MGSFRGHHFKEGGEGNRTFPVWQRRARSAILDLPGSNTDIVQRFGRKSDTLELLVTVNASELDALMGDVGSSGSLVYHKDTSTAYLDALDGAHEIITADLYTCTLHLIKQ